MGQRVVSPILRRTTITATTSCRTEFFHMARAQWVGHIPTDTHENDVLGEMGSFEAHRHRLSPSCCILGHRGTSYPKATQMKICDTTAFCCASPAFPLAEAFPETDSSAMRSTASAVVHTTAYRHRVTFAVLRGYSRFTRRIRVHDPVGLPCHHSSVTLRTPGLFMPPHGRKLP